MRKEAKARQSAIAPADVDAALALLASERDIGLSVSRSSVFEFVEDLLLAGIFFTVPVGLAVVWFDPWLGAAVLLSALVCSGVYLVAPASGMSEESQRIEWKLESLEPISVAKSTWERSHHWFLSVLTIASIAIWIGGVASLVIALVRNGETSIASIVLVALGSFTFWTIVAIDQVGDYHYYMRVERALESIRTQADVTDSGTVMVSAAELDVLSQAETQHLHRVVEESAKQLPDVLDDSYAVTLAPEALDSLGEVAEKNLDDWLQITETIHSLQLDPRPTSARRLTEIPGAVQVIAADHGVEYRVDDDLHRIYVMAIESEPKGRPNDVE